MSKTSKPIKLSLLCAPKHVEVTFSTVRMETGDLATAVLAHLREMLHDLRTTDSDSRTSSFAGFLGRVAGVSGTDLEELRTATLALGKLLDPTDAVSEKTLRVKAESFVDDYLLMNATDARRLIEDIVAYASEQLELAKEIRRQKDDE